MRVVGTICTVTFRRTGGCPFWDAELTDSRMETAVPPPSTETISPTMARADAAGDDRATGAG